jgi:hypothetical protein
MSHCLSFKFLCVQLLRHLPALPPAAASPSSASAAAAADGAPIAHPARSFPRALRRALPLRVLQLISLMRAAQTRLIQAAAGAGDGAMAPPPDLALITLQQLLIHHMPTVHTSHYFHVGEIQQKVKGEGEEEQKQNEMEE